MAKAKGNSRIKVGDDANALFLKDNWIWQAPSQEAYPELMMVSSNLETAILESSSNSRVESEF